MIYNYRFFNRFNKLICMIFFILLIIFLFSSSIITKKIENGLYRDDIIYSKQTAYQKIVITKHKDDLRLFLDGNIQFSSQDEYRYHEALVHVPFAYANKHNKVLI